MSLALLLLPALMSQTPPTADSFLHEFAETRRYAAGRPVRATITPDDNTVLFLRSGPKDALQMLFAFDVATGKTEELLTPDSLLKGAAQTLSPAEKARLERQRISARGFTAYSLSKDGAKIVVALSGKLYLVERATKKVTALPTGDGVLDPQFSPDSKKLGYVRDNDVFVLDLGSLKEQRLTHGGTDATPNGLAEFVAQEEMSRFSGFWWSPDSASIAYQHTDHAGMERFAIVDPMHPEKGAEEVPYPRPGKANAKVRLFVGKLAGGKPVEVKWDAQRYPYLATVKWPKNAPLSVLVQNRTQTEQVLYAVDAASGKSTELLTERDAAWLNLDQEFPRWKKDGSGFLWFTERNGGPELEERDSKGAFISTWVRPEAGLHDFVGFDDATNTLYFTGSQDATEQVLYRVARGAQPPPCPGPAPGSTWTDPSELEANDPAAPCNRARHYWASIDAEAVPLTFKDAEDAHGWQMAQLSDSGRLLVVQSETPHRMFRTTVFHPDGSAAGDLPSVAVEPRLAVHVQFHQVGERKFNAAAYFPEGFKKGQKYPVIVEVYGGPGHPVVRKSMLGALNLQWMANHGYLVVHMDGRGTPNRGREWERAIKGDFATVTLQDQVDALQALGKQIPEMDLSRVGIEGWSFGGYMSALAAEHRSDLFKAAVAGAPVVDWLDYDTHYTERYLGLPEEAPRAYEVSSLLSYAHELDSALLLIHGTADDNVYFSHTLKLSDALFRAGKRHEVLPLANFTHMVPDPLVMERLWTRIIQHFDEHLKAPAAQAAAR